MQERQIVTHFLVPAGQHMAETVHPTMRALYDPSPRFVPRLLFDSVGLFTSRAEVGGKPKLGPPVAHLIEVIAFVQTQALRLLRRRCRP
jgi:hypothetical protein